MAEAGVVEVQSPGKLAFFLGPLVTKSFWMSAIRIFALSALQTFLSTLLGKISWYKAKKLEEEPKEVRDYMNQGGSSHSSGSPSRVFSDSYSPRPSYASSRETRFSPSMSYSSDEPFSGFGS